LLVFLATHLQLCPLNFDLKIPTEGLPEVGANNKRHVPEQLHHDSLQITAPFSS